MKEISSTEQLLKDHGLKSTKQRSALINILLTSTSPMHAEQLLEVLKSDSVECNLSTVYRNMDLMIQCLLIAETKLDQKSYYSIKPHQHGHYIQCLSCKQVLLVEGCPMEQYEKQLEQKMGFKMIGHRVELFGICKDCHS